MLRTPSARSAAVFARGLNSRIRDRAHKPRTAKLRLDTLENREQPGSVLDGLVLGLAGVGMVEPFQVMASVFGPEALTKDPDEMPIPSSQPEAVAVASLPLSEELVEGSERRPENEAEASQPAMATISPPTVDVSDLSIADPIRIDPPVLQPAPGSESSGPSGSGGGASPSAPAGSSPAAGPATFIGTPNGGADAGNSEQVTDRSGRTNPTATGDSLARANSAATSSSATGPAGVRTPRVWVEAVESAGERGFRVWRDGSDGNLSVRYRLTTGGAESTVGRVDITDGNRSAAIVVPGGADARITLLSGGGYRPAVVTSASLGRGSDQMPKVAVRDLASDHPGLAAPALAGAGGWSSDPVRYWDGKVLLQSVDLGSVGFGGPWGVKRSWSNLPEYANDAYTGSGWIDVNAPRLLSDGTAGLVVLLKNGQTSTWFMDAGGGAYNAVLFTMDHLRYDSTAAEFVLTNPDGDQWRFFDPADTALPVLQRGQLKSFKDRNGNVVQVIGWRTDGKPTEVQRAANIGGTTTTESFLYAYVSGGVNDGLLASVTSRRQVGAGSWTTLRVAEYSYYDGATSNGPAGTLKSAAVKDASGNSLSTEYYRYWTTSGSTSYAGGLKYAFRGDSYARLKAWADANATTVDAATDTQVQPYADHYFEYDQTTKQATKEVAKQAGGTDTTGQGTFTFAYTTNSNTDMNHWWRKTVETLPDGNQNIVYTNRSAGVLLQAFKEVATGNQWMSYNRYASDGRVLWTAQPSAVTGYSDTYADLLNFQLGVSSYLRDTEGLFEQYDYYSSTTATATTAGGVNKYPEKYSLRRGEQGTAISQVRLEYFTRSDGTVTIYPVATSTGYRNENGTGGQTSGRAYSWGTGFAAQSITLTYPTVTTGQNGPGTAATETTAFNGYGRPSWFKDAGGFLQYRAFDVPTGAITKTIADVDTTQTSTFADLPSGWSTPTGGGLHITSTAELDVFGRTTGLTDPNGNVSYFTFDDVNREMRAYAGWNTSTNTPTGPTQVVRADLARGYTEALTMSATPAVTGGRPTGTEAVSGIQTLARDHFSTGGQLIHTDEYYDLTGVTYSTAAALGTEGTNYNRNRFGYDSRGHVNRTESAARTIYRSVFDAPGREASSWVGTDDTPTSGTWSPTNTAGTDLVKVWDTEYDAAGIGDGNRTKETEYPGGGAANRVAAYAYDWRNRPVAVKDGVETTESTSLNRPIAYVEYDNLDEVVASELYDGDTLSITADSNSDGVPDRPSSGALRAKSTAAYDEQQRVYQEKMFSVDPSTGAVSSNALTSNSWYDARNFPIKSSDPGGLVAKAEFDGVGRPRKSFLTDGGGDSAYADADDVTGDAVPTQTEWTYDATGNPILVTARDRFHDESGTGALGTPATGVKARVSYAAGYFDRIDRPTADVAVGTFGGSAYTRPSSVPARSDTVLVADYGYNADNGWLETVTDPRGLIGKSFYDLAGRPTKAVGNSVDGTVSDADDKTVEFTYNPNGAVKAVKALLTGGGSQTTENVFGVSTLNGLVSNDLAGAVKYPDPSTGSASTSEQIVRTVNQLGEVVTATDRNGTKHEYTYDVLGRVTVDKVADLGSGVDGAVRRIESAYDGQGNAYLVTSYDATTGGNVVNQVQREFNGLGQLTREYQATNGAVNTGTTPSVQYAYSFAPSGSTNHSRLTSITYPNGRVITYNYASGLSDTISRLTSITDGATTLESYEYLGLDTVVKRAQGSGVRLDYTTPLPGSQGPSGGSTATNSASHRPDWSNPGNALVSDNARATVSLSAGGSSSEDLTATGFGFSIPSTATVVGVEVAVERRRTGGNTEDTSVRLVTASGPVGADKADTGTNWPTTDTVKTYGGAADAWSAGLTPADVNGSGFGVRLSAENDGLLSSSTAEVDDVRVTVYYTVPTGDAGDPYTGLDRFGRIVDQAWLDGSNAVKDRRQHGYDRDSNRLYADNLVSTSNSELYAYDGLNQLTSFQRGTLNATKTGLTGSATRSQSWDFDALGNFDGQTTDGTAQTRSHNKQNEITAVGGATTPTYDANGNLTTDQAGQTYKYDAWNRLVEVRDSGSNLLATYRYDGLSRRVRETRGSTTADLYYSDGWQVIEERVGGTATASYVWSPVYVDALIARDRDTDANGSLDERLYALHDANFNVVALVNASGTVVERYRYDPYGGVTVLDAAWVVRAGGSSYAWVNLWQGLRRDPATGTYAAGYREIHAILGRALQTDPLGFGGGDVNLHRWEANQPTNVTDPSGLSVLGLGSIEEELVSWWNRNFGWTGRRGGGGSSGGGGGGGPVYWGPDFQAAGALAGMIFEEVWRLFRGTTPANWPDLRDVSNTFAGIADYLTGGATGRAREGGGYDDAVDYDSKAYARGLVIGEYLELAIDVVSLGGLVKGVVKWGMGRIAARAGAQGGIVLPGGVVPGRPGGGVFPGGAGPGRPGGGGGGGMGMRRMAPERPPAAPATPPAVPGRPATITPGRRTHILDGDRTGGGHRPGTGHPGKSEFPAGWSDDKIIDTVLDVARHPASRATPGRGGRVVVEGRREGIDISVILEADGRVVSAFPTNVLRNPW